MELPYATEIRALRADTERAARAREHLGRVETTLVGLTTGSDVAVAALVEALRDAWPDLDLSGDHHTVLARSRSELGRIIGRGERAGRELHGLMERQWSAMEGDEFASIRDELADLIGRRAATHASYAPVEGMLLGLRPLIGAFDENLPRIAADLRADAALARSRGAAVLHTLVSSLFGPLDRLGLAGGLPPTDLVSTDPNAAFLHLVSFRAELEATSTRLHRERLRLKQELDAVDASLRARTG